MDNKAAFMTGINKLELREVPVPEITPEEVLIRVEYVGICGSDMHYMEYGRIGDYVVEDDFVLGHECAGEVVSVGAKAKGLQVGDKVCYEPNLTCGECEYCRSGDYNLCPDVQYLSTPPVQGCFARYMAFPASLCFKLPENVSTKEGALVEPFSVGLEAAKAGGVKPGSRVLILGAGCIGLMSLLAAKTYGAADVTVVDIYPKRLEKALEIGATHVINATDEDPIAVYAKLTGSEGADVVIEAAGAVETTQQTVFLVKRGGTIILVGMPPEDEYIFNFAKLMGQVAQIKTIFRFKNTYPMAIRAIADGSADIAKVVTNEFALSDITEAFNVNINKKAEVGKIVIRID
ncbi:sorbitol dehydrogenase [Clostridia bacterium]|nr:sorbitol dehydrogenase [Clostridia bacterium]